MLQYFLRISAVGGGSGIQVALLSVLSLLLARYLSMEDFGITRTVTAYMAVLLIFGVFCVHDAVACHTAGAHSREERSHYLVNGTYLVALISVSATVIMEVFIYFGGFWSGELKRTFSLMVLFLPLASLTVVYSSVLQAIGSYRRLTISLVLGGAAPLLLIMPPTAWWGLSGWILGKGMCYVSLLVVAVWFVVHLFRTKAFREKPAVELMAFAKVQMVSGILSMLLQSADVIALERLKGDMREVALYGMAALFGKSILFLPGAVGRVYFRDIAESAGQGTRMWHAVSHLLLVTIGLCVFIALAVFACAPFAIRLLYGPKYSGSIPVLNILCVGIVFSGIWSALSVINIAMKNPRGAVLISAAGFVVCIALLAAFVPRYGAVGAAWGMNGAYAAGSLVGLGLLYRIRREESR
jgi:O-antigen/teichoic acid export membrane protein